ncbi:hypothetical protein Tco_0477816 [Tanacetum coccineum]
MSSMGELTFFLELQVKQKDDGIFISKDKYVVDILKKSDFATVKTASTLIETNKALLKDEEAEDVDVYLYRSMIGSLMYLAASRPDIMFVVYAYARFQVTTKVSHLHAVKRIFRYLKGQPKLGLWYPRDSPFDLEAFSDSDYAGASLDRKSTTGGFQFLGKSISNESRVKTGGCKVNAARQDLVLLGNTLGSDEERIEQDDLMDFVPPTPYDSPLSGGHTPGSDEGRPNINELMAICTNLSNRVLALEQSKTAQDLVIRKLKKKVKKLEKKLRARTPGMKLFKIGTSKRKSLDEEYVSKQGRKSDKTKPMFDDSNFAELDVDNAMENVEGDAETQGRNTAEQTTTAGDTANTAIILFVLLDLQLSNKQRPEQTSVIIHDVEEEPRRSTPILTTQPSSKDKDKALMLNLKRMKRERAAQEEASNAALIAEFDNVQARMEADALLAARLQEKEREQFSIDEQTRFLVETIAERKRFFAAQRAEQIRNKPPTKFQLRNKMTTYLQNMIKDFIPMDSKEGKKKAASNKKRPRSEPDEESVKRQTIGETLGSGEEQSAKKEKELSEEELHKLLVVVLVEEVYVEALQDLVKKRFSTTEPTDDKEKELWGELKRLFEPDNDDILWKLQRYMHDPLVWRLYDACGVHRVSSVRGHDIFMLVEKEYPLTRLLKFLLAGLKKLHW